jgi:hypothetical protein
MLRGPQVNPAMRYSGISTTIKIFLMMNLFYGRKAKEFGIVAVKPLPIVQGVSNLTISPIKECLAISLWISNGLVLIDCV